VCVCVCLQGAFYTSVYGGGMGREKEEEERRNCC
jgi:hypothetical protein